MNMNMCIIMTMNIYITKANEEWLRKQPDSMSGIINVLIAKKRGINHHKLNDELIDEYMSTPPGNKMYDKDGGEVVVIPFATASKRLDNGVCKIHGTPLTVGGKCLQKGCKYA